ncbi:MAG: hypothetical protein K0Q47_1262 [Sedimentibacter sp.]|nr:hypothetical protein [Sedimentibacter sp.]
MKIILLPKSRTGKWSVGLCIYFIVTGIFLYGFAELLNVITSDVLVTIVGSSAIIAQVISFVLGVITVLKNKECCSMVYIAIIVGLIVLLFIFGDILGISDI